MPLSPLPPRFLRTHLWFPLSAALLLSGLLMGAGLDQWLADQVYRLQGHRWTWQDAWLASDLLHRGGRRLSTLGVKAIAALCLLAWLCASLDARAERLRWPLLYLLLAGSLGAAAVSLLKHLTNMDCPWSLLRYGGSQEFFGLFEARPPGMARGVCFPAGHASAGYAWVSLYFFALMVRPAWRWRALSLGLAAGAVFGLTQQLRGAHFLSHDLWSLTICWLVSLAFYLLWQQRLPRAAPFRTPQAEPPGRATPPPSASLASRNPT